MSEPIVVTIDTIGTVFDYKPHATTNRANLAMTIFKRLKNVMLQAAVQIELYLCGY